MLYAFVQQIIFRATFIRAVDRCPPFEKEFFGFLPSPLRRLRAPSLCPREEWIKQTTDIKDGTQLITQAFSRWILYYPKNIRALEDRTCTTRRELSISTIVEVSNIIDNFFTTLNQINKLRSKIWVLSIQHRFQNIATKLITL